MLGNEKKEKYSDFEGEQGAKTLGKPNKKSTSAKQRGQYWNNENYSSASFRKAELNNQSSLTKL